MKKESRLQGDKNIWEFLKLPPLTTREKLVRFRGIQFIKYLTNMLHFKDNVAGCASIIFNRFYSRSSNYSFVFDIAAASFLLSSKLNDSHCSVSTLAGICAKETFKTVPTVDAEKTKSDWEASIYYHEEKILIAICYDLQFPDPLQKIERYSAQCNIDETVIKLAKTILADSYNSEICVRYKSSLVASSCIYMASEFLGKSLEKSFFTYVCFSEQDLNVVISDIKAMFDFLKENI